MRGAEAKTDPDLEAAVSQNLQIFLASLGPCTRAYDETNLPTRFNAKSTKGT